MQVFDPGQSGHVNVRYSGSFRFIHHVTVTASNNFGLDLISTGTDIESDDWWVAILRTPRDISYISNEAQPPLLSVHAFHFRKGKVQWHIRHLSRSMTMSTMRTWYLLFIDKHHSCICTICTWTAKKFYQNKCCWFLSVLIHLKTQS